MQRKFQKVFIDAEVHPQQPIRFCRFAAEKQRKRNNRRGFEMKIVIREVLA